MYLYARDLFTEKRLLIQPPTETQNLPIMLTLLVVSLLYRQPTPITVDFFKNSWRTTPLAIHYFKNSRRTTAPDIPFFENYWQNPTNKYLPINPQISTNKTKCYK